MDKELDPLAQQALRQTAQRLRDTYERLGAAHVSARRARDSGGPDFTDRIQNLHDSADALVTDIQKALGTETHPASETLVGRNVCRDN